MTSPVKPFWADRSLYLAILGMVLPFLSAKLGVPLDAGKCADIAVIVVGFVLAHKGLTASAFASQLKADAAKALGPDVPVVTGVLVSSAANQPTTMGQLGSTK